MKGMNARHRATHKVIDGSSADRVDKVYCKLQQENDQQERRHTRELCFMEASIDEFLAEAIMSLTSHACMKHGTIIIS